MDGPAPYLRIVAEIRDRIARGELRPGDRVPSTRRITREWGVAMATATKVIAVLRDEGLVVTRSGAGTVVARPGTGAVGRPLPPVAGRTATPGGPAAPPRGYDLSRDRIVRAAVAVADADGLAALSMRRVATDLGVATMSLYRHVPGKDELLLLMTDAVFAEEPLQARPPSDWRERLETAARLMWTVFRRHPWAAEVLSMTRPQLLPHLMTYAEWSLSALRGQGLGVDDMMNVHLTLFGHVRGVALGLQSEAQAEQDTGMTADEWIETQGPGLRELLASGRFPALGYLVRQQFDYDIDAVFEYGLQRLLDGVAVRLASLRDRG
ncbi:TetR/AcrR family transcriptional regulator C-terminal domain-containing protein [Planosporangium sp. 12N6]|uniref:TetR/AcrR family transcriptional regulator C-terminal domain-containing protein n=1 Tax=Planosporangium spinosum TaxID=3402278 RepID=UPI003CE6E3A6